MTASITWAIDKLDVKPVDGQHTDVVVTAWWSCVGIQSVDATPYPKNFTAAIFGETTFAASNGPFTPYPQLTQEQVLGWCWENGVDKVATEEDVQEQINLKVNPPLTTPPLPWVQEEQL